MKQSKLGARREQWLSQGEKAKKSKWASGSAKSPSGRGCGGGNMGKSGEIWESMMGKYDGKVRTNECSVLLEELLLLVTTVV